MAEMNKPKFFAVNLDSNLSELTSDQLIIDVKAETTRTVRLLPPVEDSGHAFVTSANHFKLKDEEGDNRALACLAIHGNEETGTECWLCKLVEVARQDMLTPEEKTLVLGKGGLDNGIQQSKRFYAQVLEREDTSDGPVYRGPKLLSLPKTASGECLEAMRVQQRKRRAIATDPEKGQDIDISRTGTGRKTKYRVDLTGDVASLDDIFPGWQDKMLSSVIDALRLKVFAPDIQKQFAMRTFGDLLDWKKLEEMGL